MDCVLPVHPTNRQHTPLNSQPIAHDCTSFVVVLSTSKKCSPLRLISSPISDREFPEPKLWRSAVLRTVPSKPQTTCHNCKSLVAALITSKSSFPFAVVPTNARRTPVPKSCESFVPEAVPFVCHNCVSFVLRFTTWK